MNRRTFLRAVPVAAGGLCLLGPGCTADSSDATTQTGAASQEAAASQGTGASESASASLDAAARAALQHPGVQLFTLRNLLADDFEGTLRQVAEIGYDEVEFAGLYDRDPADVRRFLNEIGLSAPSGHVQLEMMRNDPEALVEMGQAMGHDYLVLAYLTEEQRGSSMDTYRALASTMNEFGARCQEAGLQFAYHNHDFEFETFGGEQPAYDVLLDNTEPGLVDYELDLYWIATAGYDPLGYFSRYAGRFPLFHVKDRTQNGEMASVGDGALDFASIFARAEEAGLQHAFVEHDNPQDAMASIRRSYTAIEAMQS